MRVGGSVSYTHLDVYKRQGVYTTNKVCGAPIKVDRAHLKDGYAQAIIVNSGNANTCLLYTSRCV